MFAFWIEDKKNHFVQTLKIQNANREFGQISEFWSYKKNIDDQRDFYLALAYYFNIKGEHLKIAKMNDLEWRLENSKKMGESENFIPNYLKQNHLY